MKKAKLDTEGEAGKGQDAVSGQAEDAEEELPEEAMEESAPSMEVDQAAPATTAEPKIRFKKGKTAEGASAHFTENPYTFIEPEDPIIKACVYALSSLLSSLAVADQHPERISTLAQTSPLPICSSGIRLGTPCALCTWSMTLSRASCSTTTTRAFGL